MKTFTAIQESIVSAVKAAEIECFYSGIRNDIAMAIRVAPNNAAFNAAWGSLAFYQSGDGLLKAALPL